MTVDFTQPVPTNTPQARPVRKKDFTVEQRLGEAYDRRRRQRAVAGVDGPATKAWRDLPTVLRVLLVGAAADYAESLRPRLIATGYTGRVAHICLPTEPGERGLGILVPACGRRTDTAEGWVAASRGLPICERCLGGVDTSEHTA